MPDPAARETQVDAALRALEKARGMEQGDMKQRPAANAKEAQVARLIAAAHAARLTVYAIEVGPRFARVVTQPLGESAPPDDAADRWLRGKLDEDQSGGRA